MFLRRSKRIAEKEAHKLQNHPENFPEETIKKELKNVFVKMGEYLDNINRTESMVTKLKGWNKLSCYILKNKNIIIFTDVTIWNYNKLIKMIYDKYNETYYSLPNIIAEYKVPKYIINNNYELTREVIIHCKNELWKYKKYVFKLPLPNDLIRHIVLEWL